MQWEEEQTPLFLLHFPKLLRILLQKPSDRYETQQEYCRVRMRSMLLALFFRIIFFAFFPKKLN